MRRVTLSDLLGGKASLSLEMALRIENLATLRREAVAWNRRVNRERVKIDWRFDRQTARRKFGYKKPVIRRFGIVAVGLRHAGADRNVLAKKEERP